MTDNFEVGEIVVMWPGKPEMRILPMEGLSATVEGSRTKCVTTFRCAA